MLFATKSFEYQGKEKYFISALIIYFEVLL